MNYTDGADKTSSMANGKEFSLFDISTDYKKLWDLIHQGFRVPAWTRNLYYQGSNVWDIVEVLYLESAKICLIGVRELTCPTDDNYEDFEKTCKEFNLHYVLPSKRDKAADIVSLYYYEAEGKKKREVIFSIPNSEYRAVCRYGYSVHYDFVWWCHIQKKQTSKMFVFFGKKVERWITVHEGWWNKEIDSLAELRKLAMDYYSEEVLLVKALDEKAANLK